LAVHPVTSERILHFDAGAGNGDDRHLRCTGLFFILRFWEIMLVPMYFLIGVWAESAEFMWQSNSFFIRCRFGPDVAAISLTFWMDRRHLISLKSSEIFKMAK
jgi:NADH:ubiquinone oxidoreductase subunit 4 (subunit M)